MLPVVLGWWERLWLGEGSQILVVLTSAGLCWTLLRRKVGRCWCAHVHLYTDAHLHMCTFSYVLLGVYKHLVETPFGGEIPSTLVENQYDCVVMKGGFAAGHLPLAR